MKIKIYTNSHNLDLLKNIKKDALFTSEEHAYLLEREFGDNFKSKEALINWEYSLSPLKFLVIDYLKKY